MPDDECGDGIILRRKAFSAAVLVPLTAVQCVSSRPRGECLCIVLISQPHSGGMSTTNCLCSVLALNHKFFAQPQFYY